MRKKMIILVDLGCIYHSNYHILSKFSKPTDKELSKRILASIDKFIFDYNKQIDVEDLIICADSKSFRCNILNDYKYKISKPAEEKITDYTSVVNILSNSWTTVKIDGFEADDLIFLLSRIYEEQEKNILIIGADYDLYQCINYCTGFFNFSTKEFIASSTVDSKLELLYKIFIGCKSDNIPKLLPNGIGKKAIMQLYDANKGKKDLTDIVKSIAIVHKIKPERYINNINLVMYSRTIYRQYIEDFDKHYKFLEKITFL